MDGPYDLRVQKIPLSSGKSGQQAEHGLTHPRAYIDPDWGDGMFKNEGANGHLAGVFALKRMYRLTNRTERYHIVPVDNFLKTAEKIEEQLEAEDDRLIGTFDDQGLPIAGEIEEAGEQRRALGNHLSLTPEKEAEITSKFALMVSGRERAFNPLNRAIGERAARLATMYDTSGPFAGKRKNPRAKMAMTHPLQADMRKRHGEINTDLEINGQRARRITNWILDENARVGNVHEALDRLIESGDLNYMGLVLHAAKVMLFRVQPMNEFSNTFGAKEGPNEERIQDIEMLKRLRSGLVFSTYKNYLLTPQRQIAAHAPELMEHGNQDELQDRYDAVLERMAALEEMDMPGPYNKLRGRILTTSDDVLTSLRERDSKAARGLSKQAKQLIIYHCLPKDDREIHSWYQYVPERPKAS